MQQLLFNPTGTDDKDKAQIFKGNPTGIINLNSARYEWAVKLYTQMRDNFWQAPKIDLSQDVVDYANLTPSDKKAYEGVLSYLIYLDSVQTNNIPHLVKNITSGEIRLCLNEQTSQEGEHDRSYTYILETIVRDSTNRQKIYDYCRNDDLLRNRCQYITDTFQPYIDNPTDENYFKSLVADYVLEGLYFQQGFIVFYCLASRNLMNNSADIIKLIHRDELSHVRLYQKLVIEAMQYYPHDRQWITDFFFNAVKEDIKLNKYLIGEDFLGITPSSIEQYSFYLANIRLKAIGLEPLSDDMKNPYKHLEKIADNSNEATTKANFFETGVTSYMMSSGVSGWEEI